MQPPTPMPMVSDAADKFETTLSTLERALHHQNILQNRADAVIRQIIALSRTPPESLTPSRQSELRRHQANLTALQLSMSKAQRSFATAHRAYLGQLEIFHTAHAMHDDDRNRLQQETARQDRRNGALQRTLQALMTRMEDLADDPDTAKSADFVPVGSHRYIPLNIRLFLDLLIDLDALLTLDPDYSDPDGRYRPVSFLEVGCGTGRNIVLARAARLLNCASFTGFDINPAQVEDGQRMFNLQDELIVADAMTFDYGDYDVVFCYRPFSDLDLQQQLEAQMVATMRPTAYLLAPLPYDLSLYPDLDAMVSAPDIWKKTG